MREQRPHVLAYWRAQGRCQWPECDDRAMEVHHLLPVAEAKQRGDLASIIDVHNLAALCVSHHLQAPPYGTFPRGVEAHLLAHAAEPVPPPPQGWTYNDLKNWGRDYRRDPLPGEERHPAEAVCSGHVVELRGNPGQGLGFVERQALDDDRYVMVCYWNPRKRCHDCEKVAKAALVIRDATEALDYLAPKARPDPWRAMADNLQRHLRAA